MAEVEVNFVLCSLLQNKEFSLCTKFSLCNHKRANVNNVDIIFFPDIFRIAINQPPRIQNPLSDNKPYCIRRLQTLSDMNSKWQHKMLY